MGFLENDTQLEYFIQAPTKKSARYVFEGERMSQKENNYIIYQAVILALLLWCQNASFPYSIEPEVDPR